jgi:hypothetical protein
MAFKTARFSSFLRLVWHELSSWGSGVEFSFYDHLQERIDQLEQELTQAQQPLSSKTNDRPSGMRHGG